MPDQAVPVSLTDKSPDPRLTESVTLAPSLDSRRQGIRPPDAQPRHDDTRPNALMRRILDGDEEALAVLYDRYSGLVYSILHRIIGDSGSAEEVLQDIFVWLWQRGSRFDPARGELAGLLAVVARNRAIDRLRRQRPDEFGGAVPASVIPFAVDLESDAVQNELRLRVRLAIASLSQSQREVLELAYFQGLTHSEIAQQTGDPLGTVKARLRAALKALAGALDP